MPRPDTQAKILTGNRLRDGRTVYYTGADWSAHVGDAAVAHGAAEAEAFAASDPFVTEGVATVDITEVALGMTAPRLDALRG